MAYLYLSRHPFPEALERIRAGIPRYNQAHGLPDRLDAGYHDTLTVAFAHLIHAAREYHGPKDDFDRFCQDHAHLLCKRILRLYYTTPRIMTWEAKERFVEPDITPLPDPDAASPWRANSG